MPGGVGAPHARLAGRICRDRRRAGPGGDYRRRGGRGAPAGHGGGANHGSRAGRTRAKPGPQRTRLTLEHRADAGRNSGRRVGNRQARRDERRAVGHRHSGQQPPRVARATETVSTGTNERRAGRSHSVRRAILPGATVGVLGSGQLGRMFAIAARRMGYRVHTLSPEDDTPTGQVADLEINAAYDDLDAVRRFAAQVAVVTFEFENVPAATAAAAAECAEVRPAGSVLHTTQHRLREKAFLRASGFPVTPFMAVRSAADLDRAMNQLGLPAVLKTAGWGYDGKGQIKLARFDEAGDAWRRLATDEAVLEAWVDFECEASVVAARGL